MLPGGTFVSAVGDDRLAREFCCSGARIKPSTAAMIRILRASGGIAGGRGVAVFSSCVALNFGR